MAKSQEIADLYLNDQVVRACLDPLLSNLEVGRLRLLIALVEDYHFPGIDVYCKALAILTVNAVMEGDKESLRAIDGLFVDCLWLQFRVAFVESFRRHCVSVLAATDIKYLDAMFKAFEQPETLVPTGTRLLEEALKIYNFENILTVASKAPYLVYEDTDRSSTLPFDKNSFPIDRRELESTLEKGSDVAAQFYKKYTTKLASKSIFNIPNLRRDIRKRAAEAKVEEGSPLETLLLTARPVPVCMPASTRLCAYYLAFLDKA
jgi:hypothetical protein